MNTDKKAQQSHVTEINKEPLKRVLGISDLFAIGYGDLGSSIFYALGLTAMFALGATPLALALAGVVFICTALSYAEMTSMIQDSGGSASFARHAFNDMISFISGWGLLLDYIVTIAISAFTIGPYLSHFFPLVGHPDRMIIFTVSIIGILFAINVIGVKQSTRISFYLMAFTLVTQGLLMILGFYYSPDIGHVFKQMAIGIKDNLESPSWPEFIKGTTMAMVAYTGIESIAQLSSETKRPFQAIPRSIIVTMFVIIVMYMGLSTTALSIVTPHDLGFKFTEHPILAIVQGIPWGKAIFTSWVAILAAVVLFVASNAGLIGASRLAFNMGQFYQLPRFFQTIHPKFKTPYMSLVFFALAASLLVILSEAKMSFLADLYNFGAQIAFFSTHLSLIVMRIKKPQEVRPFKVPLNITIKGYEIPITAIIGALATFSVWLLVVFTKPSGRYLGFGWIIVGLCMYFYYRRKKNISAFGQVNIEKVSIPEFHPLEISNMLLPVRSGTQIETVQVACEIAKLHKAKLTAVYVAEIPFTLPLDITLPHRGQMDPGVLKIVQAIANEVGVDFSTEVVRSRSFTEAVLDLIRQEGFDLLILGMMKKSSSSYKSFAAITDMLVEKAPCKVWVCGSGLGKKEQYLDVLIPKKN